MLEKANDDEDESKVTWVTVFDTGYSLYKAIMKENISVISKIVDCGLVNTPMKIKQLVEFSKDLTVLPIHVAASFRKVQSLKTLLDYGANPELSDQHGRNALHLVITNWPSVPSTRPDRHPKFQSSIMVMQRLAEDCLWALCQHGVDPNGRLRSPCRRTALHLAVTYRAQTAIGILGRRGAVANLKDHFGMTPLHMAAGILQAEIVSSLLRIGAEVNQVIEHSGNSVLHLAVQAVTKRVSKSQDSDLRCVKVLLKRGASLEVVNLAGRTPLHEACHGGHEELVDLLLKYGADINRLTSLGESCLFLFLTQTSNLEASRTLLAKLLLLTNPLVLVNRQGKFPHVLNLPQYSRQREQLIRLSHQTRDLFEICRIHFVLHYHESCRTFLKKTLPEKLYDAVFHHWDCPSDVEF